MFNFGFKKDLKHLKLMEKHKKLQVKPDFGGVKKHIKSLNRIFGKDFAEIQTNKIVVGGFELKPITLKYKEIKKRDLFVSFRDQLGEFFDNGRWDKFKLKFTQFNDNTFCVLTVDTAIEVVKQIHNIIRNVLKVSYKTKISDCDDFYVLAKSFFIFILYISGVKDMGSGIATVKINYNEGKNGHAINMLPLWDWGNTVWHFYEPQRYCYIKTPAEIIEDKPEYEDFRIFYFDM